MTTKLQIQFILVFMIFGFLAGPRVMSAIAGLSPSKTTTDPNAAQVLSSQPKAEDVISKNLDIKEISPFSEITLQANSIYVWDINTHKKLFARNEHAKLPLASVTKIMMALVAKEFLSDNTKITITPLDILQEGDSGLLSGETWDFDKLLNLTLIASSNDGASAIASVAGATMMRATTSNSLTSKKMFVEKMNERAKDLGLTNTYFRNESGLDIQSVTAGGYGSARDMAMLFEYVLRKHPDLFTPTTYARLDLSSDDNIVHRVLNTNQGVAHINGIIGSKTGFTDLAGGNLVIVVDIGIQHPIVIAVLGSTYEGRFSDVEKLIGASVQEITGKDINK